MKHALPTLLLFMFMQVAGAAEVDLSGSDAEFMMESIKGGRNTPTGNPNQGVATSMTFELSRGGFDLTCKALGLIFIKTTCRLKLNAGIQDPAVKIAELGDKFVVTFTDTEFVDRLAQGLLQNPWKSVARAQGGSELVSVECATNQAEKLCRLNLSK